MYHQIDIIVENRVTGQAGMCGVSWDDGIDLKIIYKDLHKALDTALFNMAHDEWHRLPEETEDA